MLRDFDLSFLKRISTSDVYTFVKLCLSSHMKFPLYDAYGILSSYNRQVKSKELVRIVNTLRDEISLPIDTTILLQQVKHEDLGHKEVLEAFIKSLNKVYKGFLLASEPGLGKTYEAVRIVQLLNIGLQYPKNVVYLGPKAILSQNSEKILSIDSEISLESYHYKDPNLKTVNTKDKILILDEAHLITNPETDMFQTVSNISKDANFVIFLTATPIRSSLDELNSYLYIMLNQNITFEEYVNFYNTNLPRYKNLLALRKIQALSGRITQSDVYEISNIGLLRVKKLVLKGSHRLLESKNLLLKNLKVSYKTKLEEVKELYSKIQAYLKKHPYFRTPVFDYLNDIIEFQSLKDQISNKKFLSILQQYKEYSNKSIKQAIYSEVFTDLLRKTLITLFSNYEIIKPVIKLIKHHQKCILFTKSRASISTIKDKLQQFGIEKVFVLEPELSSDERYNLIKQFERSKNSVLISTYKSLAYGFDIPNTNCILLLDLPYRPYEFEQAVNRINRLGQTAFLKEIYILATDSNSDILTHDELILKAYKSKIDHISDSLNSV